MRILLDTNILLRIADSAHRQHAEVVKAAEILHHESHVLVIVPQTLYEFWAVATRSLAANGLGMEPAEARELIDDFCNVFRLLRDERRVFENWLQLVTTHEVRGANSHDVRLAAAMLRHGVSHFLTLNPSDFRRFEHVTLLDPADVVDHAE